MERKKTLCLSQSHYTLYIDICLLVNCMNKINLLISLDSSMVSVSFGGQLVSNLGPNCVILTVSLLVMKFDTFVYSKYIDLFYLWKCTNSGHLHQSGHMHLRVDHQLVGQAN